MKTGRRLLTAAVLLAAAAVGGCHKSDVLAPPELHLGQDTCHSCNMIVSDERFAGAIVLVKDGERQQFVFDDLGELMEFVVPTADQVKWYVHDYNTRQWIDATTATFIKSATLHSPMDGELAAFASAAQAQEAARPIKAQVLSFSAARVHKTASTLPTGQMQ